MTTRRVLDRDRRAESERNVKEASSQQSRDALPARYRVQSVQRALDILEFVAEGNHGGVGLADIARYLDVSKSTAFSLVQTLVSNGFLAGADPGPTRRYRLGFALARLGDKVLTQTELADIARPILQELAETLGQTTRLGVADGHQYMVSLCQVEGPGNVRFSRNLGRRELVHCTALGKAFLSTLSEREVRAIVADVGLPQRTRQTITKVQRLLEDLALTRERGYALDDEEDADGVLCVGAPVFDHTGRCVAAISSTTLKFEADAGRIRAIGNAMRTYAARLSTAVGWDVTPSDDVEKARE